jgi:hypothetical protein
MANKINWRFGRKFVGEKIDFSEFNSHLLPADVILSHRKFELTNFFIGGYYTHAGIVLSSENMVEVTSKGVQVLKITDFAKKSDDFVILRSTKKIDIENVVINTQKEVGKKYNYTFIPNTDTIICSELIFKVFDLKYPNFLPINANASMFFSWFQQYSIHPEVLLFHPDFEVKGRLIDFMNVKSEWIDKQEVSFH